MSRRQLVEEIHRVYPDRVPVLVTAAARAPPLRRTKFLAPGEMLVAQFQSQLRKHMPSLAASEALFLLVGRPGTAPRPTATMEEIYQKHKDADGFLGVWVSLENTFGGQRKKCHF